MNQVYLKAGSNPATGLFLDKLNPDTTIPPCGAHMPNLGAPLTAAQFACVQSYLPTTLTEVAPGRGSTVPLPHEGASPGLHARRSVSTAISRRDEPADQGRPSSRGRD